MSTHNIHYQHKKRKSFKIIPNTIMSEAMGLVFVRDLNEPSVFKPLKFYCITKIFYCQIWSEFSLLSVMLKQLCQAVNS